MKNLLNLLIFKFDIYYLLFINIINEIYGWEIFCAKPISELMKSKVEPDKVDGYLEPLRALNVLMKMNEKYACEASVIV